MLSDAFKRFITPPARILNLIWLAMLAASVVYGAVAWFVTAAGSPNEGDFFVLRVALGSLAAVLVTGSFLHRRKALGEESLLRILAGAPESTLPGSEDLDPLERRLAGLFPHYQTTNIVVLAMREAVAVLGLILAILARDFWAFVPFGVVAVATMAIQPPAVGTFMEKALPLVRRAS